MMCWNRRRDKERLTREADRREAASGQVEFLDVHSVQEAASSRHERVCSESHTHRQSQQESHCPNTSQAIFIDHGNSPTLLHSTL